VYLGVSKMMAYKIFNESNFPCTKILSRKYVNKEMLDKWLLEQTSNVSVNYKSERK